MSDPGPVGADASEGLIARTANARRAEDRRGSEVGLIGERAASSPVVRASGVVPADTAARPWNAGAWNGVPSDCTSPLKPGGSERATLDGPVELLQPVSAAVQTATASATAPLKSRVMCPPPLG